MHHRRMRLTNHHISKVTMQAKKRFSLIIPPFTPKAPFCLAKRFAAWFNMRKWNRNRWSQIDKSCSRLAVISVVSIFPARIIKLVESPSTINSPKQCLLNNLKDSLPPSLGIFWFHYPCSPGMCLCMSLFSSLKISYPIHTKILESWRWERSSFPQNQSYLIVQQMWFPIFLRARLAMTVETLL